MRWFASTRRQETLIVTAVFLAAAWWGASYWDRSLKAGREPQFYQLYFEPAVMIACHHGFVISHPQPKPLEDFLWRRAKSFSCDQVASNTTLSQQSLYQGAWRYMMYAVGFTWRFTGVSWSRMGPLFGILFGLTIAAGYGIFRLGMARWLALAGAFALSVSTLHLSNLPHLRDYSKAPFTLGLILILGFLVTTRVRRSTVMALAAAYGLVLGIGYGFRTDLLVDIPPILIVLFLFLEGGFRRHLATKFAGAAAFFVAFLITAWPILSFVNEKGGGQWHVVLLGLTTPFDEPLQIEPAIYDLGHVYEDGFIVKTSTAYAARVHPEWQDLIFGTHQYDIATGAYLREIVTRFPGDLVTRAYAAAGHVTTLAFAYPGPPMEEFAHWLYKPRGWVLDHLAGWSPLPLVTIVIVGASAYDLRVGLFLLFFLVYFGGYPALQFGTRHYFHFEFIGWWAAGAFVQGLIRRPFGSPSLRRVAVLCAVAVATLVVPLAVLRLYQAREVRAMFNGYVSAPKTPIALAPPDVSGFSPVQGPSSPFDVKFMEIDLNRPACGEKLRVTYRYDKKQPVNDYSRTVDVGPSDVRDTTRLFAPVYAPAFQGVELADVPAGCLAGAYWVDPDHRPLLLNATLLPGWEHGALHQSLQLKWRRR